MLLLIPACSVNHITFSQVKKVEKVIPAVTAKTDATTAVYIK